MQKIVIFGFGGFGREIAWLAEECNTEVVCFLDHNQSLEGKNWQSIPIYQTIEQLVLNPDDREVLSTVIAVGNPQIREKISEKLIDLGHNFVTLIHPNVRLSKSVSIEYGTLICAGSILTVDITIGKHVHINLDCTIGHDVVIADYVTLAPGVHISGNVHIGERAYIGTGAVIRNGTPKKPLKIGNDAVIGMGSVVVKDVPDNTVVVGNPAKPR